MNENEKYTEKKYTHNAEKLRLQTQQKKSQCRVMFLHGNSVYIYSQPAVVFPSQAFLFNHEKNKKQPLANK